MGTSGKLGEAEIKQFRQIKSYLYIYLPVILLLAGVSAWRSLTILKFEFVNTVHVFGVWLALTLCCTLGWALGLYGIWSINRGKPQQWLSAAIGAVLFSLLGFLLMTPAGFSRIAIELWAENVWKPDIFTSTWPGAGNGLNWSVPFILPVHKAQPAQLEIVASALDNQTTGETWLLAATWPGGQAIPLDEFQAAGEWQQHQVNWGPYQDRPVWVARPQNQSASLAWTGQATGPLTLLFVRHQQAGKVTLHWNGVVTKTFDLYAPTLEFQGVTLPVGDKPVVWRAGLPASALAEKISLVVEADPNGVFPVAIQKISIAGAPGQILTATGRQLAEALQINVGQSSLTGQFNEGQINLTDQGVRLIPRHHGKPFQLLLNGPLATNSDWMIMMPWIENGLAILHLSLIGGLALSSLARLTSPTRLSQVNVAAITIIVTLLIGELTLQWYLPEAGKYYVRHPNQQVIFKPQGLVGVTGESRFVTNSQGFRGDEFSNEDDYRLLAVGGSTTECLVLDQLETWPRRLQDHLNDNEKHLKVWIGNAGQGGRTTREHIMHLKYLLPQYPSLDAVIMLIGINDLGLRLSQGQAYDPAYLNSQSAEQDLIERAFYLRVNRDPYQPFYQQSTAWRLIDTILQANRQVQAAADVDIEDEGATAIHSRRELRKKALIIKDELPDLSSGLAEYERNINTIIDIAQAHKVRLLLLTQPTLWSSDLTPAEQDLLWFGWGGDREFYYSVEALNRGMSHYNQILLEVCQQRQVECLDLAKMLPKDTSVFFDDVHFNESGAEQVAKAVADYMLTQEPFSKFNE